MWLRHWNLVRDPFARGDVVYVSTPPHDEAVARLVYALRSGERLVSLSGEAGLGKSTVLARALSEIREPGLRIARAAAPVDGHSLHDQLARSLRLRLASEASKAQIWRALSDAARTIAAQRGRLLLVVDDVHLLSDRVDLDRLLHLHPGSDVTVVCSGWSRHPADAFPVGLGPLTRTEAGAYLGAKLRSAGRHEPTFAPSALTGLHALAEGVPRRLDRWAGLAMQVTAVERLPVVTESVVRAIGQEVDQTAAVVWSGVIGWPEQSRKGRPSRSRISVAGSTPSA